MFVVRIEVDSETQDFKAFSTLGDARARVEAGRSQTVEGEFDSISLFEVVGTADARTAVNVVKAGASGPKSRDVTLLEYVESTKRAMSRIKLDFSSLTKRV